MPALTLWEPIDELAKACREAAAETKAGLCDGHAAFNAVAADRRPLLFVDDQVHLAPTGQRLLAETVAMMLTPRGR